MFIEHKILKIKKIRKPNTNYIEEQINQLGFIPLRWAITKIDNNFFTIDCAVIKQ